jgi:hypothetical protein
MIMSAENNQYSPESLTNTPPELTPENVANDSRWLMNVLSPEGREERQLEDEIVKYQDNDGNAQEIKVVLSTANPVVVVDDARINPIIDTIDGKLVPVVDDFGRTWNEKPQGYNGQPSWGQVILPEEAIKKVAVTFNGNKPDAIIMGSAIRLGVEKKPVYTAHGVKLDENGKYSYFGHWQVLAVENPSVNGRFDETRVIYFKDK